MVTYFTRNNSFLYFYAFSWNTVVSATIQASSEAAAEATLSVGTEAEATAEMTIEEAKESIEEVICTFIRRKTVNMLQKATEIITTPAETAATNPVAAKVKLSKGDSVNTFD